MNNHADKAIRLFKDGGYNCAQAVFVAFCDVTGISEDAAIRLSSSFGGGMGRLREVCGAFSGALMAFGMLHGPADPTDPEAKGEHYRRIQELATRFRARSGSIICRELLADQAGTGYVPAARTEEYFKLRPCERLVYNAAELLDEYLLELSNQA